MKPLRTLQKMIAKNKDLLIEVAWRDNESLFCPAYFGIAGKYCPEGDKVRGCEHSWPNQEICRECWGG